PVPQCAFLVVAPRQPLACWRRTGCTCDRTLDCDWKGRRQEKQQDNSYVRGAPPPRGRSLEESGDRVSSVHRSLLLWRHVIERREWYTTTACASMRTLVRITMTVAEETPMPKSVLVAIIVSACTAVLVGQNAGPDWPQWRGPSRDGTFTGFV